MFGYINPIKAELETEQRKEYQLFYCTLCQTLGNNYGSSARMALSYDATLLAIMIVGIQPNLVPPGWPHPLLPGDQGIRLRQTQPFWG
ncbi:MAG TPA: hypothetical protein GXX58_05810 [Gelria sp.]|jgi:hypothetical protein|nr:hypothetical protein [Gelria sp.]